MSTETKKKGFGPFKFIIGLELLIFIGLLVTGFVFLGMFIRNSVFFEESARTIWFALGFIYGAIGMVPVIIMPTLGIMLFRKRKVMFSSLQSFKLSKIGPYAPGYKPSGSKKPRFCEYCGFEVMDDERECPECGGPVRTINRSYI